MVLSCRGCGLKDFKVRSLKLNLKGKDAERLSGSSLGVDAVPGDTVEVSTVPKNNLLELYTFILVPKLDTGFRSFVVMMLMMMTMMMVSTTAN